MKRGKQTQITTYLRPAQKAALQRVAKNLHVPAAQLLREGVDMVVAKYQKRVKG